MSTQAFQEDRGVSLVWVVILMTIVMVIVAGLTSATIKELRMTTGTDLSTQAFGAARAGIEANSGDPECASSGPTTYTLATGTTYTVTTTGTAASVSPRYCDVESTGTVAGVTRKLKQRVLAKGTPKFMTFPDDVNATSLAFGTPSLALTDKVGVLGAGSTAGSDFSQQFDVSLSSASLSPIGTGDGTFTYMVGLSATGALDIYKSTSGGASLPTPTPVNSVNIGSERNLRFLINYKNEYFSVKIKNMDGKCLGYYAESSPTPNYRFNRIYVANPGSAYPVSGTGYLLNMVFPNLGWVAGPVAGIKVMNQDIVDNLGASRVLLWSNYAEDCKLSNRTGLGKDCDDNGNLKSGSETAFNDYPAQKACINIGGRLPTDTELTTIMDNQAAYGGNFDTSQSTGYYQTSTQTSSNVTKREMWSFNTGWPGMISGDKTGGAGYVHARCVQDN
jgi:Tfp pilus assembly protein PilV